MRIKVEYNGNYYSKYEKDHADKLMAGWNVVDSSLTRKDVFIIWWSSFIYGWIIYEKS